MVIRSYRRVFEVDRRIYRVDRWALPVPGGVPLRAVGYFLAALLLVLLLGRVPGVAAISAPIRFVVLPLGLAVLATQAAPDGRTAHRFAADWLWFRLRSRRRCAGRVVALEDEPIAWDGELPTRWDGDGPRLQHGRVRGPATITFNVPVELRYRGRRLVARPATQGATGEKLGLFPDGVLEVRP